MRGKEEIKKTIEEGKAVLGIEFGSTRIKAVLIDEDKSPIASGSYDWENQLVDNIWTYSMEKIQNGLQGCYQDLVKDVEAKYNVKLTKFAALGVSAMMHGYLAFDENDELLVPFRTWRNTITEEASEKLTELFSYHIPQRWSIAHLYQAILNGEEHVKDVRYITTLAGYIHWKLTGKKVLGNGDAAGMFPIDIATKKFDEKMMDQFDELTAEKNFPWKIREILPGVLVAGEDAGVLTEVRHNRNLLLMLCYKVFQKSGSYLLSFPYSLQIHGTGSPMHSDLMYSYYSVPLLQDLRPELLQGQFLRKALSGLSQVLPLQIHLFRQIHFLCGLLAYNYFSGEHITGFNEGRPLFVRKPDSKFNLANFMRVHLYTSLGALKTGMNILLKKEHVALDRMMGHGGLFKTKGVGQRILAGAIDTPVYVMETAGEGGAWGIALLADYLVKKEDKESLTDYLENKVFHDAVGTGMDPVAEDVEGYEKFMETYAKGLAIEKAAVENL